MPKLDPIITLEHVFFLHVFLFRSIVYVFCLFMFLIFMFCIPYMVTGPPSEDAVLTYEIIGSSCKSKVTYVEHGRESRVE